MHFKDQIGSTIILDKAPERIVSLVPSQTELLYTLGLDAAVVGITKFCVHPSTWFRTKQRVGGTKQVHLDIVKQLSPDLIIANKEENLESDINELMNSCPVWVSDVETLEDAYDMISGIGQITRREAAARQLVTDIRNAFSTIHKKTTPISAAYFIWRDPWMVAGGDTFISNLLEHCGIHNCFADQLRYPVVTPEMIAAMDCKWILLSSEPYPFKEKHIAELKEWLPDAEIRLVDGEMFSWYGSHLLQAPAYFNQLLDS